jgi:hypothetical protein
LQTSIIRDIQRDFERHRREIKEDISQSILARYLPESMLIERDTKTDPQVLAATKLILKGGTIGGESAFDALLARSTSDTGRESWGAATTGSSVNVASFEKNAPLPPISNPQLIYKRESTGVFKVDW